MADIISNTHVGSVDLGDSARAHIGNVLHIHQAEDRCLSDLRVTDPLHDKARIEATKGGLIEDSYRWILEHSDFRQWCDDERSRLLWIKGYPGKGKTMLLCGIVNELAPHTKLKDEKANVLLSYFFCQAADERINSATAVLRGLTYLMVEQQPSLISHIQRKYKHGGEAIFKDTCVIIDALDECVTDLLMLLDFINTKSTLYSHIKWIVSSRNWPDIEEQLNADSVSAAVNAYIGHQVNQLAKKKKYSNETKDAVHRHLSSNSNDTFLWVALVCQNLEKMSLQNPLQRLKKFPPGLDALYGRMVEQILHLEDISNTEICCRILEIVLLVYRPLTLPELGSLTGLPYDDDTDTGSIDKAIGLCGSFLTVRDRQVYIIHQSAKDYLSDKALSTTLLPNPADVHDVILSQSIQAMSIILRRNIYNLHSPGISSSEIKAPDPDPLSPIRYSCIHWVDHFCDMHSGNGQSHNRLDDEKCQMVVLFLRKCLLYWLEALGLMGTHSDLSGRTVRHISLVRSVAFSTDSRYLASGSDDRTIKIWDVATGKEIRTFLAHWYSIYAVAFSADGCCLASGSFNETIRIWDVITGKERQTLQGHKYTGHTDAVLSVTFSADGRYLASGSWDGTIKIWDTTTGKEKQTLDVGASVRTISFDDTASYLHTNIGLIKLGVRHGTEAQSADWSLAQDQDQRQLIANNTQKANHFGYGLSSDRCWITWQEHNILWLPPEYQPSTMEIWSSAPRCTSAEGSPTDVTMALGTKSGRVVIIRMPSSGPYPLL
ncbi:hypothetical protein J3F84DRAFT_398037 [Trichoderma pleuroticola]